MQAHLLSRRAASSTSLVCEGPEGLAHDAGNLLNALGLYCDLLEAPEVLQAEHKHYVVELRAIARRSAALLGRLGRPVGKSFVSNEGLSGIADLKPLLRAICGTECGFEMEFVGDSAPFVVDTEAVERIVLNLVKNAAEAISRQGRSGGVVRLLLKAEDEHVELSVEDNGPGMELLTAARFVQPEAKAVTGGRGVGHRILYELAQETGAELELKVRPGQGSQFCFRWMAGENGGHRRSC